MSDPVEKIEITPEMAAACEAYYAKWQRIICDHNPEKLKADCWSATHAMLAVAPAAVRALVIPPEQKVLTLLADSGLVDRAALTDPEGYDKGATLSFAKVFCASLLPTDPLPEPDRRAGLCMYCGFTLHMKEETEDEVGRVYQEMIDHDQHCEKNPLVKKLAGAERAFAEINLAAPTGEVSALTFSAIRALKEKP